MAVMKPYIKAFGYGVAGKRADYLENLREFAKNTDGEWNRSIQSKSSTLQHLHTFDKYM